MVTRRACSMLLWMLALAGSACRPNVEGRPSFVDGDRILAVRSVPAEAKPGTSVVYRALYVGPDALPDSSSLDWALCSERKPLAVNGPVAPGCLQQTATSLSPLGQGESAMSVLPKEACRIFGPTPPDQKPGEPASRPADPDTTGGYYQPVRVLTSIEDKAYYAVGVTRLDCGLSGATQEQASNYAKQHQPNENPELQSLAIRRGSSEEIVTADDANPTQVNPNRTLRLRARWASCPSTPVCGDGICSPGEACQDDCGAMRSGCTGAEPYLSLDTIKHELVPRREAIRVSFFATAGRFEHERAGRTEQEAGKPYSDNTWTAPNTRGEVRLWVVIRDDRGGVGWGSYKLDVQP